ncbi:MAG: hypothetical protein HY286_10635 [Planctomycetes bacterium]|nr:hypothetical protein [Planctomycetota bacterium]
MNAYAQGPIAGKTNDGTPKAGIAMNGALRWGRLVDIWAVDSVGNPVQIVKKIGVKTASDPLYLDILIGESIGVSNVEASGVTPPVSFTLKRDTVSGSQILIIGAPYDKNVKSRFQIALTQAESALGTIAVGGPTSLPPYSQIPRDAAIAINFDRAINPNTIGPETVQFYVGTSTVMGKLPPAPFLGRFVWKPEFPKTIIIDPTINAVDDNRISDNLNAFNTNPSKNVKLNPQVLPINSLGLPASISTTSYNIAIFIPSQYNIKGGVTKILLGKDGTALDINKSVTKYVYSPSGGALLDGLTGVARVFRSGSNADANQGFIADPTSPQILGSQQVALTAVEDLNAGDSRVLTFKYLNGSCNLSVRIGDSIQQGSFFATVSSIDAASLQDADPLSYKVTVNYLQSATFNTTDAALLTTPYNDTLNQYTPCFVILQPQPSTVTNPLTNLDPQAAITVRFSKPMDVTKVNSLRNYVVLTNPGVTDPALAGHFDLVVGNVIPSPDLKSFKFVPYLPYPHLTGSTETYKFVLLSGSTGVTDLAGNPLPLPTLSFTVSFSLKSSALSNSSRFFNMRFDSLFDVAPATMLTGQITKPSAQEISGRPPSHFSRDVDRSNPFINAMAPFTGGGIQTPLSSLGSRLQTVYRHIDMNLSINAVTDTDLDVEGLSWAPYSGILNVSDYFQHIRIDLSHSAYFPDEIINQASLLPSYTGSGLQLTDFAGNIFALADHPTGIVYEGAYTLNQNMLYTTSSGTVMMPWPKFTKTYTWRDSSYGSVKFGGPYGNGVNPDQYYYILGLTLPTVPSPDKPYAAGAVPSVALPLLMDFRTYPASDPNTKGLNGFTVVIAVTSSAFPSFRVYSTGGLDTALNPHTVTPDVAPDGTKPTGAYYPPGSTQGTPGTKTSSQGPEVYPGRVDLATKVSRVYSHFFDFSTVTITSPVFVPTNVLMLPTTQSPNTSVAIDFRGGTSVNPSSGIVTKDARCFDIYGDVYSGSTTYAATIPPATIAWSACGAVQNLYPPYNKSTPAVINFTPNITDMNSKTLLQFRFTFTSDIINNVTAKLNAMGIAYSNPQ